MIFNGIEIRDIRYKLLIAKSTKEGINLIPYIEKYKDYEKVQEFYLGLKDGLDVSLYDKNLPWESMREVRYGLKEGLDVSLYNKVGFNYNQIKVLREGLEKGVDVSLFNNPSINEPTMKLLIDSSLEGIDISKILIKSLKLDCIKMLKKMYKDGIDTTPYLETNYNQNQLKEIYKGILSKIDYSFYSLESLDAKKMEMLRMAMEFNIDVSYIDPSRMNNDEFLDLESKLNEKLESIDLVEYQLISLIGEDYSTLYGNKEIEQLKYSLNKGLDTKVLLEKKYTFEQMEELIYGMEDGIDVSWYTDEALSDIEMSKIRLELLKQKNIEDFAKRMNESIKNSIKKSKRHTFKTTYGQLNDRDFLISDEKDSYLVSYILGGEGILIDKSKNISKLFKRVEEFLIDNKDLDPEDLEEIVKLKSYDLELEKET